MAGMMIMHTWTLLHDLHHLVNGAAGQTSRTRRRRVDNICKVGPLLVSCFAEFHADRSMLYLERWLDRVQEHGL